LNNVPATPHSGYVGEDIGRMFYSHAAAEIAAWLDEKAKDLRD
jgi:hypothetical protein